MMNKKIRVINDGLDAEFFELAKKIILRKFDDLGNVTEGDGYELKLKYDGGLPEDAYKVEKYEGGITVYSATKLGWLSGAGRVMQEGAITEEGFEPGEYEGKFEPARDFYGAYFATHFGNWYMKAPLEEVGRYIEELALTGGQRLIKLWFDLHHYTGIDDPEAQEAADRLHFMMLTGKKLGMKVGLGGLANEGYSTTPEALKAEWKVQGKYRIEPGNHYHVEICPHKPGGMELILKHRQDMFEKFADVDVDLFGLGVYDQGGCTCAKCASEGYGAGGYVDILKEAIPLTKKYFPNCKFNISGWHVERFIDHEWGSMFKRFEQEKELSDQIDYIAGVNSMDMPKDEEWFEKLREGIGPADTKLIGFPEISMQGCYPWGGFGANPYPERIQKDWDTIGHNQVGMWSYSEGIFEDINKYIVSGLYSGRFATAQEGMRSYVRHEFSPIYTDEIMDILNMMEETLERKRFNPDGTHDWRRRKSPDPVYGWRYNYDKPNFSVNDIRFVVSHPEKIEEIMERVQAVHEKLPEKVRNGWRWQLVYIRAMADYELKKADFYIREPLEKWLDMLNEMYYVQPGARYTVVAPTRAKIREHF